MRLNKIKQWLLNLKPYSGHSYLVFTDLYSITATIRMMEMMTTITAKTAPAVTPTTPPSLSPSEAVSKFPSKSRGECSIVVYQTNTTGVVKEGVGLCAAILYIVHAHAVQGQSKTCVSVDR